jgi:hypothetical protein
VEVAARPLEGGGAFPRLGIGVVLVEEGEGRRCWGGAGLLEVGEAAGLRAVEAAGERLRVAPEAEVVRPIHLGTKIG